MGKLMEELVSGMEKKLPGMLGIRPDAEDWESIATIRQAMERTRPAPFTVTEVVRLALRLAAQIVVQGAAEVTQSRIDKANEEKEKASPTPPAATPKPAKKKAK